MAARPQPGRDPEKLALTVACSLFKAGWVKQDVRRFLSRRQHVGFHALHAYLDAYASDAGRSKWWDRVLGAAVDHVGEPVPEHRARIARYALAALIRPMPAGRAVATARAAALIIASRQVRHGHQHAERIGSLRAAEALGLSSGPAGKAAFTRACDLKLLACTDPGRQGGLSARYRTSGRVDGTVNLALSTDLMRAEHARLADEIAWRTAGTVLAGLLLDVEHAGWAWSGGHAWAAHAAVTAIALTGPDGCTDGWIRRHTGLSRATCAAALEHCVEHGLVHGDPITGRYTVIPGNRRELVAVLDQIADTTGARELAADAKAASEAATARMAEGRVAATAHRGTLRAIGTPPDQRHPEFMLAYAREVHAQMVIAAKSGVVTPHMTDTIRRSAARALTTAGWTDADTDADTIHAALEKLSGR